jgi:NADH-quinone oxidoreductase subunit G
MFENATTAKADVLFPLETHAEKDGTITHPDGRLQRVRPSASRPGDIRPNVQVLAQLSSALGHDTGITAQPEALAALTEAIPFYAGIDNAEIAGRGIRWQDRDAASSLPAPGAGSSDPERATGPASADASDAPIRPTETTDAARGAASAEAGPVAPPAPGSLALGTYRDLWAGPITELNPPLKFLEPQQRVEMAPADAERLGLASGDEVSIAQNGSSISARVAIRERIAEGVCFLIEGTAESNANALLNGSPVAVEITKAGA